MSTEKDHHPNACEDPFATDNPLATDVLCGRGGFTNNHKGTICDGQSWTTRRRFRPNTNHLLTTLFQFFVFAGNVKFRSMTDQFKEQYKQCSRHEKTALSESLVRKWRDQEPPGRFLKLNSVSGLWEEVGELDARRKCSQLLREDKNRKKKEKRGVTMPANKTSSKDAIMNDQHPPAITALKVEPCFGTPDQRKASSEPKEESPNAVMDMPFFDVQEATVDSADNGSFLRESSSPGLFARLRAPKLSDRLKQDKTVSSSDGSSPSSSALGSFLTNMLREKAAALGVQNVCVLQDNSHGRTKVATASSDVLGPATTCRTKESEVQESKFDRVNQPVKICPLQIPAKITPSKRSL